MLKINRKIAAGVAAVALLVGVSACGKSTPSNSSQATGQRITESYAKKYEASEPFPLSQINDSAERKNLIERLLRLNDPNKIGYLIEFTNNGQVTAYVTTKGKVSSTGSQLTNTEQIINDGYPNGGAAVPVSSMGDDGSYGPEECQAQGIVYFDTNNVMHEDCVQNWTWSDAPVHFKTAPIYTIDSTPTSTAGVTKGGTKH